MDLQTDHLLLLLLLLLLFTMKFFCIFFRINFSKKLHFLRSGARKSGGI